MNQLDDWQLLSNYAKRNSEEAFRALVDRYAGLVYYTALRHVGKPHVAQDVTQSVFIALAHKAGSIRHRTVLSGWLFRATRFAVMNLMREEVRRQRREQEASMDEMTLRSDETESIWERISPHLDDALAKLSSKERDAVLARFFENKSHKEVARTLGVSEDAAKVRVSRAVAKLRLLFAERGFAVPPATLSATLSAFAALSAPSGLTTSVTTVALTKGFTETAASLTLAKGILKQMAWHKLNAASAAGLTLLIGIGLVTVATREWSKRAETPTPSATTNLDRSTPKGTLRYLAAMLDAGEARKVAEAVQFGAETNLQTENAVANLVSGQTGFKRALTARFGEGNVTDTLQRWSLVKVPTDGLDKAEERIEGLSATVQLPGKRPLRFVKTTGSWRLVLSTGNDPKEIAQFNLFGKLMGDAANELNDGKYSSADEVFLALQARLTTAR